MRISVTAILFAFFMLSFPAVHAAEAFDSTFQIMKIQGAVTAKIPDAKEFGAVTEGDVYPYGTQVRTARNASAVLRLGEENIVRMLARSRIAIERETKHRNLVRVRLEEGEIGVQLDNRPEDVEFEVDTPLGVCGAVGTWFTVTYLPHSDGVSNYLKIEVQKGAVSFTSAYAQIDEDILREGAIFELIGMICRERQYAFLPQVSVQGQDLNIALGDNNKLMLEDGAVIQAAMANVPGDNQFVAVRVLSGRIMVGGDVMDVNTPARFIRGRFIMEGYNAEDYMNAAEWLCRECNLLLRPELPFDENALEEVQLLPEPQGPQIGTRVRPVTPVPPLQDVPQSGAE